MQKAVFDFAHQVFKKLEKLGDLKILLALRDSITASVPVLGAGTVLFFFLFPHPGLGDRFMKAFLGGLGLMAFGVSAALPWKGSEGAKGLKGIRSGLSVLLFVLTLLPTDGWIQSGPEGLFLYLSRAGLFVAIILSLLFLGAETLVARSWKTRSPLPAILIATAVLAGILLFLFIQGISVHDVANFLVKPLLRAGDSLPWVLLILLVMSSLWLAGLHGAGIVGGIITPIYVAALQTNVAAHNLHEPLPHIVTPPFFHWVLLGGSGGTFALPYFMLFSRSRKLRQLGRLSLLPGLCNINEPLIYGVPLVMNPAFFVPFILGPMVVATADYLLIAFGWMNRVIFYPPFFIPAPISAFLATGGDPRAPLWILLNMLILALVNYPFFRRFEVSLLRKEKEAQASSDFGGT